MQSLYTVSSAETEINPPESKKILNNHFNQSQQILHYLSFFLTEVCRFSESYAQMRASKHITSFDDLNINTRIAGNTLVWKFLEDPGFVQLSKKYIPSSILDNELVKKIYLQLAETNEYKTYTQLKERDPKAERDILEFILDKMMLANEDFISHMEENFSNWDDDAEMTIQLIVNFLNKPGQMEFRDIISADKKQFAEKLLETVLEKKEYLQSLITPKLKNWDADRIALLDMILMKMGVAEFLYFETIPPKVTINEYIDLAKEYSTQQSGQFVNGILDNIHKELVQQNLMKKVDFKKA